VTDHELQAKYGRWRYEQRAEYWRDKAYELEAELEEAKARDDDHMRRSCYAYRARFGICRGLGPKPGSK
jgi:hypothetical protein